MSGRSPDGGRLTCAEARGLLHRRLDGDGIGPEAEGRYLEHLTGCADCREAGAGLQRVQTALRRMPAPAMPDLALERVWRQTSRPLRRRRGRGLPGWRPAAAAAALAAVLLGFWAIREPSGPTELELQRAAAEARMVFAVTARTLRQSQQVAFPRRASRGGCAMSLARCAVVLVLTLLLATARPLLAAEQPRGFVDGDTFVDLVGDDCVRVQVWLPASLIRAISKVDSELAELVKQVHSLQMLILDMECAGVDSPAKLMRQEAAKLAEQGWERLVLVREDDAEIRVLALMNGEETIDGLVLMMFDRSDRQLIFANIAGTVDLAAIQALAEGFDIPGLEDIELP